MSLQSEAGVPDAPDAEPCTHDIAARHFSRLEFTTKAGVKDFHVAQTCLDCGERSRRWVRRDLFIDPNALPLVGTPSPTPNAHALRWPPRSRA